LASVFIWGTAFASAPVFDWSVTYNVFRSDVGVAVAVDNENNIILVDSADDGQDFLLVKFDGQDGGEIWSHAYSFGGNSLNSLTDVDSNDNIIWGGVIEQIHLHRFHLISIYGNLTPTLAL
jgi:hypothetical protein